MRREAAPVVYVVDDDPAIREALSNLLRSVGLRVQSFESAQTFLEYPRLDAPSCLVLDVRLPRVGGMEFQQRLNDCGDLIPVIFITGHGDIPMSVRAMKGGAFEFLTKPFRDQELLDAIHHALARDQGRRDSESRVTRLRLRYETLSPRERQVMVMLLTGRINKQIGAEIGARESTIKAHRMQVMRKMEAASLVDLVRMGDTLGLETLPA